MNKKYLFLFLFIFSFIGFVSATCPTMNGTGSLADPYIITEACQLQAIQLDQFGNYSLGNSFSMSGWDPLSDGSGFVPIDNFYGTFDGRGFEISNFNINRVGYDYQAMFHQSTGAIFKNMTISSGQVTGARYTSLMVAQCDGGCNFDKITILYSAITSKYFKSGLLVGYDSNGGSTYSNLYFGSSALNGELCEYNGFVAGHINGNANFINISVEDSYLHTMSYAGYLFGSVDNANISNFHLYHSNVYTYGSSITAVGGVGGVQSGMDYQVWDNIYLNIANIGNYAGTNSGVAGLVASSNGKGIISNIKYYGVQISGTDYQFAGLVNSVTDREVYNINISQSGVIGYNAGGVSTISGLFNTAQATNISNVSINRFRVESSFQIGYQLGGLVTNSYYVNYSNIFITDLMMPYSVDWIVGGSNIVGVGGIATNSYYNNFNNIDIRNGTEGTFIGGNNNLGGITGDAYQSTFNNIYFEGTIKDTTGYMTGGITGKASQCSFNNIKTNIIYGCDIGTLNAGGVGGIVGHSDNSRYTNIDSNLISDSSCQNVNYVGGLIGYDEGGDYYDRFYNNYGEQIYNVSFKGMIFGDGYMGGLIGISTATTNMTITNSKAVDVQIIGSGTTTGYVGGLIGYINNPMGFIMSQSFCSGSSFVMSSASDNVGGLIGAMIGGEIVDSYSQCNIAGNNYVGGIVGSLGSAIVRRTYGSSQISGGGNLGGIVGYNGAGVCVDNFWDTDKYATDGCGGGVVGSSTADMKSISQYYNYGWDIGKPSIHRWSINEPAYPCLSWDSTCAFRVFFSSNSPIDYITIALSTPHIKLGKHLTFTAPLTFKQNDNVTQSFDCMQNNSNFCSDLTFCYMTINTPQGNVITMNDPMTYTDGFMQYDIPTSQIGDYNYLVICSGIECNGEVDGTYQITTNGKTDASGSLIVFFAILFLVLLFLAVYEIVRMIGLWKDLDFDLIDASYSIGTFLVVFGYYFLVQYYLGNALIEEICKYAVMIMAVTHVILPVIALLVSMIYNPLRVRERNGGSMGW